jgi:hypothetical protein
MSNSQARKWALTVNNPQGCGLDHNTITEILMKFFHDYFCMTDKIATTRTRHMHIFALIHQYASAP